MDGTIWHHPAWGGDHLAFSSMSLHHQQQVHSLPYLLHTSFLPLICSLSCLKVCAISTAYQYGTTAIATTTDVSTFSWSASVSDLLSQQRDLLGSRV